MIKYDSYQNSGIEWIGEIPSHWKKIPLGKVGVFYGGLTGKKGEDFTYENSPLNRPFIPFTNISNNTYILKDNFQEVIIKENEKQNKVKQFDLLFLMSSEDFDDLGKSSIFIEDLKELYLNSFCKGFRIKHSDVYPMFLNYQLLGNVHRKLISVEGNGFTRINLRQDRLKSIPVFIPSIKEQKQIVSFLDKKNILINSIIEKIQIKIRLLKEKKLKLIENILLDSGTKRIQLKHIVNLVKRPVKRENNKDYTKIGMYNWGRGVFKYPSEKGSDLGDSSFNFLKEGDLLLSGQFSWEGSVSIVEKKYNECISSHRFHILNAKKNNLLLEYLWSYFTSQEGHFLLNENSPGSAGRNRPLNINNLLKEKIPLPKMELQIEIQKLVKETDIFENYAKSKIKLLKEYQKSIISSAVTGKVKILENII